jgi:hypothetical protein
MNLDMWSTLNPQPCTPAAFVDFWSQQYDYPVLDLYEGSLVRTPITPERLRRLFTWKNGITLSTKKDQSLEDKILAKLDVIQSLEQEFDPELFDHHFGQLRVVWRVFLLHIIDNERFPIFDQHVYRAHRCLLDPSKITEEKDPPVTLDAYEEYRPFFQDLMDRSGTDGLSVDQALWAYGKFLRRYPRMFVTTIE